MTTGESAKSKKKRKEEILIEYGDNAIMFDTNDINTSDLLHNIF